MKNDLIWPVPASLSQTIQTAGPGSFWEDRGDRFHCGVDIYTPFGSDVVSVKDGLVLQIQLFTSPQMIHYWNETLAVTIQHHDGLVIRYAEMFDENVRVGEHIKKGTVIGHVGQVLEPARITAEAPLYVQKLKEKNNPTMLHLEAFDRFPFDIPKYLGGNTFQPKRPDSLVDPSTLFC